MMGRWHGRSWIPAAAAVAIALAAAPASGGPASRAAADLSLTGPGGRSLHGSWQRWARASLMPTVGGRITLNLRGCPALPRAAGCVYRRRPRTIYMKSGLQRPRSVLLHEFGHLYDLRVLNNRDRGRFRKIMRARKRAWWKGEIPLAEQFAEAYSFCARYDRIVSIARYSTYEYRPSRRQHSKVCRLILAAAGDRKPSAPPPQAPVVTRADPEPPPQPPTNSGAGRQAATEADAHADPASKPRAGADDPTDHPPAARRRLVAGDLADVLGDAGRERDRGG